MTDLSTLDILARLVVAGALSAAIGYERESHRKPAGMRTNALVGIGTALAVIASAGMIQTVMTGIGFIGGGVILHSGGSVRGLTTAASIWVVAAVGIAAGLGQYDLAVLGTILTIVALVALPRLPDENAGNGR